MSKPRNPNAPTLASIILEAEKRGLTTAQLRGVPGFCRLSADELDAQERAGQVDATWHVTSDGHLVSVPRDNRDG